MCISVLMPPSTAGMRYCELFSFCPRSLCSGHSCELPMAVHAGLGTCRYPGVGLLGLLAWPPWSGSTRWVTGPWLGLQLNDVGSVQCAHLEGFPMQ